MKKKDYQFTLCFIAVVISLILISPANPTTNSILDAEQIPIRLDQEEQQYQPSDDTRNALGGRETAFYGMADNITVRNLVS